MVYIKLRDESLWLSIRSRLFARFFRVLLFPVPCVSRRSLGKKIPTKKKGRLLVSMASAVEQIKQREPLRGASSEKQRSSLFFTRDFFLRHLVTYEEEQVTFRKVNVEEKTPFLQIRIVRWSFYTVPRCPFFSIWFVDRTRQRKRRERATKTRKQKKKKKKKKRRKKEGLLIFWSLVSIKNVEKWNAQGCLKHRIFTFIRMYLVRGIFLKNNTRYGKRINFFFISVRVRRWWMKISVEMMKHGGELYLGIVRRSRCLYWICWG